MKNEKIKLYPFKFIPGTYEKQWGSELWTVSDMGFEDSEIENGWLSGNSMSDLMETYLERVVGEDVYRFYGRQFPLHVRFLTFNGSSPLFVHPDDRVAMERFDALGKVQLWYVQEASEDACIRLGFNRNVSATEFYDRCLDGTVYDQMNAHVPTKGQYVLIEPGVPYSVSGHIKVVCVEESSDVNFVLHNPYATAEEVGNQLIQVSEAMDFIRLDKYEPSFHSALSSDVAQPLAERREFNVTRMTLRDPLEISTEMTSGFVIYICAEGEFSVQYNYEDEGRKQTGNIVLKKNEVVLVPADLPDFYLVPRDSGTVLLEVVTRPADEVDEYINPDTEPFLEGEDYGGLESGDFDDEQDDEQEDDSEI